MGMTYAAAKVDAATLEQLGETPTADELSAVLDSGLDLDKAWWAVQIVLGGSIEVAEPFMTGVPLGDTVFYGPAMLASPADVARVAANLEGLTRQDFEARVDLEAFAQQGVYPSVWDVDDPTELVEWIGSSAEALVELYVTAAANQQSILAAVR